MHQEVWAPYKPTSEGRQQTGDSGTSGRSKIEVAERLYRKHQEQMKRQYEKNKETWNLKRMEKYRETHPNPRPRGRPKKSVAPSPLALIPPRKPVGFTKMTEFPWRLAEIAATTAPEESP